jgi:hypothetical protein
MKKIISLLIIICFITTGFVFFPNISADEPEDYDVTYGWRDENNDGFLDVNIYAYSVYANKGQPEEYGDVNTLVNYFNLQGDDPFYLDTVKIVVWCNDKTLADGGEDACYDHKLRIDSIVIGTPSNVVEHPWNDPDALEDFPNSQCYQITWTDVDWYIDDQIAVAVYFDIPNIDRYYFFPTANGNHNDWFGNGDLDDFFETYNLQNAGSSWNSNDLVLHTEGYECAIALVGHYDGEATYHTLTMNVDGDGTTSPTVGQHTYEEGTSVNIEAFADPGWSFDHWSGDTTGSNNPLTIMMNSDKTVTAHFTEDNVNNPPYIPSNPSPSNYEIGVGVNVVLSWTGGDPDDGDIVTYDIYFGTDLNPPLFKSGHTETTYRLHKLVENQYYYWRIVARDNHGHISEGPKWVFNTIPGDPEDVIHRALLFAINDEVNEYRTLDAELMSIALSPSYEIYMPNEEEITYQNFLISLSQISQYEDDNDVTLIYFAGHGKQVEDEDIFPEGEYDELDGYDEGIILYDNTLLYDDIIAETLNDADFQGTVVFIFDCCYSGGMIDDINKVIKDNIIIMTACSEDNKAYGTLNIPWLVSTSYFSVGLFSGLTGSAKDGEIVTAENCFEYTKTFNQELIDYTNFGSNNNPQILDNYNGELTLLNNVINNPPNKPSINGPSSGLVNKEYEFEISVAPDIDDDLLDLLILVTGNNLDDTYYYAYLEWDGKEKLSCDIGSPVVGDFNCRAIVRDEHGAFGEWSDPISFSVSKSKSKDKPMLFHQFLEQHPILHKILELLLKINKKI